MRSKRTLFLGFMAVMLLVLLPSNIVKSEAASSNNPVFATIERVQIMINEALLPVNNSISSLSSRVTTLETSASATPVSPPLKGVWVPVGSWEDPGGLGYYFNMSPRVMDNGNHQILADCWAKAHFPNGETTSIPPRREDSIKLISPNNILPTDGTRVPIDLYCSWGNKTLEFHFDALWDSSNPHTYISY